MSSTLNPTPINPQINPQVIPKLAPDIVPTRAAFDISKPGPDRKSAASTAQKAPDATAGATVPLVDTAFRAASTNIRERGAQPSFGRRVMGGVMAMVLTACLAGAAVLWQSRGGAVGPTVAESALPLVSPPGSPAADRQSAAPAVEASAVTAAAAPSAPPSAGDNFAANAASSLPEAAQLLQSMARDLSDLRQNMEQMKAGIAALKASQDQMASEVAKTSEPNLRPWVSLVTQPPAQPIAALARKPPTIVRPVQPAAASGSPQGAAPYLPRRAVAPPPRSTAASPGDPPPPRPPAPLREQTP